MPLKVARSEKLHFFSFQANFFRKTTEICYASIELYKFEHLFMKIHKKRYVFMPISENSAVSRSQKISLIIKKVLENFLIL